MPLQLEFFHVLECILWLLVHRTHVQECESVHGSVGLLPTIPHFPKRASHRASTELAHRSQPQKFQAEHLQKQSEYGEVLVISFPNVRALFFLQFFAHPPPWSYCLLSQLMVGCLSSKLTVHLPVSPCLLSLLKCCPFFFCCRKLINLS